MNARNDAATEVGTEVETEAKTGRTALQSIQTQVMWNRLISVVEEQAQALLRTAFGSVAREAGDLSAGVYDTEGRMLAQAVTGTPGHVNTMAVAVKHFFSVFSPSAMLPGDVYVTNDPWLGTGHLFDFVVVTPVFLDARLVALVASTCHTIDVGGIGFSADARSVYEEGTCIPHLKLRRQGRLNEDLLAIVEVNSRNPVEARGDILSLVSCNDVGANRLIEMMREYALPSIAPLAEHILSHSRKATLQAIARLPAGIYRAAMTLDGYEQPIELKACVTIDGERLSVDYAGSSPASKYGINSPKCYSDAYSVFGLKCLIAPDVPNNSGSLEPFEVLAEPGSVVAPLRPSPVTARHVVGQMLPDLMFGCLEQALSGQVPGESAGSIWVLSMSGVGDAGGGAGSPAFNVMSVGLGGTGARPSKDGLATTAFPSGVGAIPIEVTEAQAPLVFWHKEFLADSGGPGRYRGGLAQRIVIGGRDNQAFVCNAATFDRRANAARGRSGGQDGALGVVVVESGRDQQVFIGKGTINVPPGARLRVDLPGGGGFGEPLERAANAVDRDLQHGLISEQAARDIYAKSESRRSQTSAVNSSVQSPAQSPSQATLHLSREACAVLDAQDPLADLALRFEPPPAGTIFLDGNSMGAMPRSAPDRALKVLRDEWSRHRRRAWTVADWLDAPQRIGACYAHLLGARPQDVIAVDNTTLNLHKLLGYALKLAATSAPPAPDSQRGRNVIVYEREGFPTDIHVVQGLIKHSQGQWLGRPIADSRELAAALKEDVAAVLLSHADYRSSFRWNMAKVNAQAHAIGARVVWDLSHSAGVVPIDLTGSNADFAVVCGYKYLSGGPGAASLAWIHPDLQDRGWPVLPGWLGHADRMHFQGDYEPAAGVLSLVTGTMPVIQNAVAEMAAQLFATLVPAQLWAKHRSLSETLVALLEQQCGELGVRLVSPPDYDSRGGHVAFSHAGGGAVCEALLADRVVASFREPDVIRFGLAPATLSHVDLWEAVARLRAILIEERWRDPRFATVSV